MSPLLRYVDAWLAHDPDAIEAAVTPDCLVIESYGPVYRGRDLVGRWAREWIAAGGAVHRWDLTDHVVVQDGRETAEWRFEYSWRGERAAFDGCSLSTVLDDRVHRLREYATTAELYDWTGVWTTPPGLGQG